MQIEVHEVRPDRSDLIHALVEVRNQTDPEINPDDPPVGYDEMLAEVTGSTIRRSIRAWVALADGQSAGEVFFDLETARENAHLASTESFSVVPALRRRGVADAIMRASLDALAAEGRNSLLLWAHQVTPDAGGAYATRLGLEVKTEERCSRVRKDAIDDALVEHWLAEGRARDDGYRLVQFGDRCPDEHVDAYLQACAAMEDIPVDDLEWTPPTLDVAGLRAREASYRNANLTVARSLVVAPDGSGAGLSDLFVSGWRPQLAWQGDTGVVAAHRGRGLGRWLKAENLRHAERLSPGFEVVETYNAQSDPWMLDINVAMGFRPHVIWRGFQGDLAHARCVVG